MWEADRMATGPMATALPGNLLAGLGWLMQVAGHVLTFLLLADTPQRVAILAIAILAVAVAGSFAAGASVAGAAGPLPVVRRVSALRDKSWRVAFLRLRDPDARGRSRPRAPSAAAAAA
jgi:Family of unknown function (DUF6412)